jgi:hypothetical protein
MRVEIEMKLGGALLALAMFGGCSSPSSENTAQDAGVDAAPSPPAWQTVLSNLDGTLLSVWGSSASDVYSVGGPLGNAGFQTLVVHFDGTSWKRLAPGGTDSYWWVSGSSATDVWMAGENGRITHWDGTSFAEHGISTTATIYGVWAASPNDAWAVGGTPEGGTSAPNDVVLHWDGSNFTQASLPQTFGRAYFKVWGTASDNLYVVGEAGTVWHRVGTTWTLESMPPIAHGTLLTVYGCSANEVYAVGGRDVLRSDGMTWSAVANVMLSNDINGVSCATTGAPIIVGFGGAKQRLVHGTWMDDFGKQPFDDLHGAWASPDGSYWAAGGSFIAKPAPNVSRQGVLARYGSGTVPTTLSQ